MTLATDPARVWVSVEGANATGKTHLCRAAAARLAGRCSLVAELPEEADDQLTADVIKALSAEGDPFLRTGTPLTETFALLALGARRYELAAAGASGPGLLLEDRGTDSVAVYQGAILADAGYGDALQIAHELIAIAEIFRPEPAARVLLRDDPERTLARYAQREGNPPSCENARLITAAALLYDQIAVGFPRRYTVIDRAALTETEAVDALVEACRSATYANREVNQQP